MKLNRKLCTRVADYYNDMCDVMDQCEEELRALWGDFKYDEGDHEGYLSHPDWDKRSAIVNERWDLSLDEREVLDYVLSVGLVQRFTAQDVYTFASDLEEDM